MRAILSDVHHYPSNSPQAGPAAFHPLAGDTYHWTGQKAICNVGSVGQPRDGDWRASNVLFDGEVIRFRRVEYEIDKTVRKLGRNRS